MSDFFVFAWITVIIYLLAAVCAIRELMVGRTSQGTIAWIMALIFLPFVTVWIYLAVGWKRFGSYRTLRTRGRQRFYRKSGALLGFKQGKSGRNLVKTRARPKFEPGSNQIMADNRWIVTDKVEVGDLIVQQNLVRIPFTRANKVKLLTTGDSTINSIFAGLKAARKTIVAQYYIIRNDATGKAFADCLIERAKAGVRVYLLYDAIGCYLLDRQYSERLRRYGVKIAVFNESSYLARLFAPFRINYRNHRKIVVVDGNCVWLGGYNIGDEYLGYGQLGLWRDTHLQIDGPAALSCQLAFAEDWLWTTGEHIELNWHYDSDDYSEKNAATQLPDANSNNAKKDNGHVLIMPSGPADRLDTIPIAFVDAISKARHRIWITSPYFVPDNAVITALYAAIFRGVDVRIILPRHADKWFVWLAGLSYCDDLSQHGIRFYYYDEGFMHQKVMLIDDDFAAIGTVNFDNRSFKINFEITAWMTDSEFVNKVDTMLTADFARSTFVDKGHFNRLSLVLRLAARAARLFSPLL